MRDTPGMGGGAGGGTDGAAVARTGAAGQAARGGGGPAGWLRAWLDFRGRRRARHAAARALYHAAVARAREPALYGAAAGGGGVPDTPDGRFELVALHTAAITRRLLALGPEGRLLAGALGEAMADDMDRSVRELGVGDLRVGKWVKGMAQALHARTRTLEAAAPAGDRAAVADALARNLPGAGVDAAALDRAAGRVLAFAAELDAAPAADLLAGRLPGGGGAPLPPAPGAPI